MWTVVDTLAGTGALLIEYGAGAGIKTEILIEASAVRRPLCRSTSLAASSKPLPSASSGAFPIEIRPVVADFTQGFDMLGNLSKLAPRAAFFPGSTIGI